MKPHTVRVAITAVGAPAYLEAAKLAVESILRFSDFQIYVGVDSTNIPADWVDHSRVTTLSLQSENNDSNLPRFLLKFELLSKLVDLPADNVVMQMDADAILVRPLSSHEVTRQLDDFDFAMVEQKQIIGSDNDRAFFRDHYINHTLVWFSHRSVPSLEAFRYFNSGVVLCKTRALRQFLDWCQQIITDKPAHHRVGRHMIADQDYFQYWVNSLHPGTCRELPWHWNHCEHWDEGFPRTDALVCHFSNFCHGPTPESRQRMKSLLRQCETGGKY